jgi:hypothetical protein
LEVYRQIYHSTFEMQWAVSGEARFSASAHDAEDSAADCEARRLFKPPTRTATSVSFLAKVSREMNMDAFGRHGQTD